MAKRAILVKGGPGVGKSTLMKKVGAAYEEQGLDVHYCHCSGDPDSVDAVYVPQNGFLMVDATSPHTLDPIRPGAGDGILNLGVCLNEGLLAEQYEEISALFDGISATYRRAYRYLNAALSIRRDGDAVYREALEGDESRKFVNQLLSHVPEGEGRGWEQHAFLQAITWKGVVQYPEWLEAEKVVSLPLPFGMEADDFLQPVLHLARQRRQDVRCWYDPLDGNKLQHLQVGSTLFTTASPQGATEVLPQMQQEPVGKVESRLSFDRAVYDLCLHQGVEALAEAKAAHDRLERYYVDAMDFGRLQAITKEVLEEGVR